MKKFFVTLTLMAFAAAAPLALAKEEKQINCCVKGKCEQMTKADCKRARGKVVDNCNKCKPPKPVKSDKPA